jgi:hypothetical protein
VKGACGEVKQAGIQPKVGAGWQNGGPQFCSAPCERYGEFVVLYDCASKVSDVQQVAEQVGCQLGGVTENP